MDVRTLNVATIGARDAGGRFARAPFAISVTVEGEDVVVAVTGELDLATADELERRARALTRLQLHQVVVDLSNVTFLGSTGLRVLISLRNAARRDRRELTLIPGPDAVQRVFDLTRTGGLFTWRPAG